MHRQLVVAANLLSTESMLAATDAPSPVTPLLMCVGCAGRCTMGSMMEAELEGYVWVDNGVGVAK